MTESRLRGESLHFSVGILAVSAGSLLLAVHHYSASTAASAIPNTALGVLLLILGALLAYTGVRKSRGNVSLRVSFCWTVSALWCSSGVILILTGSDVITTVDLKNAMVPGLAALALGLLITGIVGVIQNEALLALMAIALSLSAIHEIAMFYNNSFGSSAIACNYLIVTLIGTYFVIGRMLHILSKIQITLPGTGLSKMKEANQGIVDGSNKNECAITCLILNMVAASVFGCKLLGITNKLFVGQVAWLWTVAVYQTGLCVLSYRSYNMLDATIFAFFSILRYAEGYSLLYRNFQIDEPVFQVPFFIVFAILFFILSIFASINSLMDSVYLLFSVAYCIALACNFQGFFHGGSQGVNIAIFVISAFVTCIKLYNIKAPVNIPTGKEIIRKLFMKNNLFKLRQEKDLQDPFLGYSKYVDAEVLAHACSVLAAFAITMPGNPGAPLMTVVLPWVVVAGGIYNLICGSLAFSRGKTLESCAFTLYGMMWVIWGITRYGGPYGTNRDFNTAVGIICFMLFNSFIIFSTLFLTKAWFIYSLTFQLILISFLLDAINSLPFGYDIGVTIIFGMASFYCFLATLFNSFFEGPQIPLGSPFIKISGFSNDKSKCPHLISSRTSSVRQIAEIMKNGGICGIPTDTVYVLVAACNQPVAVEKAYKTKRQAQDRPMSLWISSLQQLEPAKHLFSPVLWDFMQAAWPSSISLVIPRGEWLEFLGAKDSSKYIGTSQSIAIRIPDCSVTTHLIDMVGPIAVTSANPSGEADTTHHNQVYAKLGDKVDGVLCDGASPENIASTVVDCTKIESGNVGFFRVGIIPKSQVLKILQQIQQKHKVGCDNAAFTDTADEVPEQSSITHDTSAQGLNTDIQECGPKTYDNGAFTMQDEEQ
ncbi:uncharacterized protein O3C94_012449 [Discoglossus pictus]